VKDRLIITISDINGSKQYNVHEFIKQALLYIFLILIITAVATYFYIRMLNEKVDSLKEASRVLQIKNSELLSQQNLLKNKITESEDKLYSMNEKLREIEEAVGIGPDINASFFDRVDMNVASIKAAQEANEKKIEAIKEESEKIIEQAKVTALQKAFLANGIPNGKILNYRRISSKFGYRTHPVTKRQDFHAGIDLSARRGTPIYAPASGVIEFASQKGAYGNFLLIAHAYGFKTAYGHLSGFAVESGQYISKGEVIGYVGNSGRSTGPHLHYEIRYLNKWVNPMPFMQWDAQDTDQITQTIKQVQWNGVFDQIQKSIDLIEF
jgi:murein DD-endopeptidase MepM/ murein hydrolase activator NlpD